MNEIIKVNTDTADRPTVMGRELHKALEIQTQYSKWFERMCEYGFTENQDFVAISQKRLTAQGNETTYTDHQLTLDMAKEICMIQRTETGRKCRQYFLDMEKQWNSPEAVMGRALKYADNRIKQLERERKELPISAAQVRQLREEITIKAMDLCRSGRLYMKLGETLRADIEATLCVHLHVDSIESISILFFDYALDVCRNCKPDKKHKDLIKSERLLLKEQQSKEEVGIKKASAGI